MNIERIELQIAVLPEKQVVMGAFTKPEKIATIMGDDKLLVKEVVRDILQEDDFDFFRKIKQMDIIVELDDQVLDAKFKTKQGVMNLLNREEPFRDLILDIINYEKYEARNKKATERS